MKTAVRVLVVLLVILLAAAGIAWYMVVNGGNDPGTPAPTTDLAPVKQVMTQIRTNSSVRFSVAISTPFLWYRAGSNDTQPLTLSGLGMVAESATTDDATALDAFLRSIGFLGDQHNTFVGETEVSEGYVKDSIVLRLVTPIAPDAADGQVTEIRVYAGIYVAVPGTN
jgi:hypothetical protein